MSPFHVLSSPIFSEIQEEIMRITSKPGANMSETEAESRLLDNKLADINKKIMNKIYALQKHMIGGDKVRLFVEIFILTWSFSCNSLDIELCNFIFIHRFTSFR